MKLGWITMVVFAAVALAETPSSQYSPLSQINTKNVARLAIAWIHRTGEPLTPAEGGGRAPAFEATPVYADGLLFISTPYGRAIALEAATGRERWTFDARINMKGNYGDFASRGVSTWVDPSRRRGEPCRRRIFMATIDARLFALDAATGVACADFGDNGRIDLTAGLRRGPSYVGEYEQTSPPAVIAGLVIVGSAIADNNRADAPTGEVRAFDARTGALRWTWHPLPAESTAGGANAWSLIRVDEERGLVFVPTGSASPDYFGGLRAGENRYANSMVALRAATGEVLWNFQTVHHDLWDYDVAAPATLFTTRRGVPAVAVGSKTGHLFLLNRATGAPLFPIEERAVPASRIEGEQAAATQPFPTAPPSLAPQSLSPDDAWGPTEEDRRWCRERIAELGGARMFTPPSFAGTINFPGNIGGIHWGGVAHDPRSGLLIVPINRLAPIARLVPRSDVAEYRKKNPSWETTGQRGAPYAMSRTALLSLAGLPCNPPPFGALKAVDTASGQVKWEVPLGRFPLPGAAPEWGSVNLGGPLATGGGLVFIGATLDPAIRAFDTATGKELWKADLPASARATPMSFAAPDGKQYVVIAAGGHEARFGKLDNAIVAFALR